MLTLLAGPDAQAQAAARAEPGVLWLAYGELDVPGTIIQDPAYPAVAAFAQRLRHPHDPITKLQVINLDTLRHGTPVSRPPAPVDFNTSPRLMELSRAIGAGAPAPTQIIISSFSRLYDQILVEIGRGLNAEPTKTTEFGAALASEALTHLCCDLMVAGIDLILVAWSTKTIPHVPKSISQLAGATT